MDHLLILFALAISLLACGQSSLQNRPSPTALEMVTTGSGNTVQERFPAPPGFVRQPVEDDSFAAYLRNLPLKPAGHAVHLFDGSRKKRQDVHAAVVDMDTGAKDLQQCADAIMRLRAEYLFAQNRFDEIRFHFTNGFVADYGKWRQGNRIVVSGNHCEWRPIGTPSTSYLSFRKYLDQVFMYAGTLSLSKELEPKKLDDLSIGDVFIQGGSPGHAVIVVDVAEQAATGKKIFMLAQSYMPAQEIHLLNNFGDDELSPWYSIDFGETLRTPEWAFSENDLKGF